MGHYEYRSHHKSTNGCGEVFAVLVLLLIPAAIISVLGNVFFPQLHFTLLGGYGIVILLRHLRGLLFIGM